MAGVTSTVRQGMSTADPPLLLGIRHHGPGSARAVRRVLDAYQPDVVLIEGPPEADQLIPLAGSEEMVTPVALLAYRPPGSAGGVSRNQPGSQGGGTARTASFWPFAEFSPEWQAILWAVTQAVPVRFMDLPVAYRFGRAAASSDEDTAPPETEAEAEPETLAERERVDPIGVLAEAAGYDDPERWWEDVVEHQHPAEGGLGAAAGSREGDELTEALAPFEAIALAMTEVRATAPALPEMEAVEERRREAYMRTVLRAATKQYPKVAVVCGAWHVPALTAPLPPASADNTVLKGLSKGKVAMTWVPWTHGRLASWTGYGAGVTSPGWYHHLFTSTDRPVARWLVAVAGLLRREGLPVSSAHVIEATRLAETLAVLRGRPLAGLSEVSEATRAVLCDGDELRMHLVDRKMVVGERLGTVPAETPSVPLASDVAGTQRRLKMTVSALDAELRLDLRQPMALERSRFLHRLSLIGVDWGTEADAAHAGQGTFWEDWRIAWRPEFAVDLIAASGYGTTVAQAATAKVAERARMPKTTLPDLTRLVQQVLLADLPEALPVVLAAVADQVALDSDVVHLMAALPALARTMRYGDVRGTDVTAVRSIAHGLVVRICVGLPAAVGALDDGAAAVMRDHLNAVDGALALLDDADLTEEWRQTLQRLVARDDLHGLLAGRLTRLLFDAGRRDAPAVATAMGLVLTIGVPPSRAAAWVEGFLADGGVLLVHDEQLLSLVDGWLSGIPGDTFVEVLPLLRRTFGEFAAPERRAIGERVRHRVRGTGGRPTADGLNLDRERAERVLPTLRLLLGRDVISPDVTSSEAS
jgi:Family of unknown function (DUF5682)